MQVARTRTDKEIIEGKEISALFSELSEECKTMAIVYIFALRNKEIADSGKNKELLFTDCKKEEINVRKTKYNQQSVSN